MTLLGWEGHWVWELASLGQAPSGPFRPQPVSGEQGQRPQGVCDAQATVSCVNTQGDSPQ